MQNQISCVIIDDDTHSCKRLEELLAMIPDVELKLISGYFHDIIEKLIFINPVIIFLEIETHKKNGFEITDELKNKNIKSHIIYVTTQSQYSIKAIKHGAFDFLLKPIDIDELKSAIQRVFELPAFNQNVLNKEALKKLTSRQREIVDLLMKGKSSKEIAEDLCISKNTVDTHRRNIIDKLGINSTIDLITKNNLN